MKVKGKIISSPNEEALGKEVEGKIDLFYHQSGFTSADLNTIQVGEEVIEITHVDLEGHHVRRAGYDVGAVKFRKPQKRFAQD